ncbi:MAG: hypothetical protein SGILL_008259 [Bacillariaceae sp.]
MQMRYYGFDGMEESPFDEPPLSADIDLNRMVEALQEGAPPSKVFYHIADDISVSSPQPDDEPRRSSQKHRQKQRRSSARWNNQNREHSKATGRRISFATKLVDIVPDEFGVKRSVSSVISHDFESETYASFLSFENSLEYFLQGEWIHQEMHDLISPINCKNRFKKNKSSPKEGESDQPRSYWGECFGYLSPANYTSKPFVEPFKWKEYTTLDTECFNVELCQNDDSWFSSDAPRQRSRTNRSRCSEDDDDLGVEEDESRATARNSVTDSLKGMLPPLESLQNAFGEFFTGPEKQVGRKGNVKGDDETLSIFSEDSTIANTTLGWRLSATAE